MCGLLRRDGLLLSYFHLSTWDFQFVPMLLVIGIRNCARLNSSCIFLIWPILLSFMPFTLLVLHGSCEELFWEINDNLLWKLFLMGVIKALSVSSLTFHSLSNSLLEVHKLDSKILTVLHKKKSWMRTADVLRNILGSILGSVFGA